MIGISLATNTFLMEKAATVRRFLTPLAAMLVAAIVAGLSGGAAGHAKFVRADPAPDSALKTAPALVRIWFSQELDTKGSRISVLDARSRRVDDGKGGVDLDDMDRKTLIVRLKPLTPGRYTVRWRALSAEDRDVTEGSYKFTVARPGP